MPNTGTVQDLLTAHGLGAKDAHKARKRYVILHRNSFRARDWDRFGCGAFATHGYEIVPVQVAPAEGEEFPRPVTKCFDRPSLEKQLGAIGREDFILNLATYDAKSAWVYDWLASHSVPYAVLTRGGLPYSFAGFRSALGLRDWLSLKSLDFRGWARLTGQAAQRKRQMSKVPAPRWWLRAGRAPIRIPKALYPSLHLAEVVPMVHFDVAAARGRSAQKSNHEAYAVFLDQMLTYHPDFQLNGITNPLRAEDYFAGMERCFQRVERDFGLEVVIAPHPKATQDSLQKLGRTVSAEQTSALVEGSKLVLCHYTTAVAYAVMFRKPVLFLTSDSMLKSVVDVWIAQISSWLGNRRLNIDRLPGKISLPVVSEPHYRDFESKLLFEAGSVDWPDVIALVSNASRTVASS